MSLSCISFFSSKSREVSSSHWCPCHDLLQLSSRNLGSPMSIWRILGKMLRFHAQPCADWWTVTFTAVLMLSLMQDCSILYRAQSRKPQSLLMWTKTGHWNSQKIVRIKEICGGHWAAEGMLMTLIWINLFWSPVQMNQENKRKDKVCLFRHELCCRTENKMMNIGVTFSTPKIFEPVTKTNVLLTLQNWRFQFPLYWKKVHHGLKGKK